MSFLDLFLPKEKTAGKAQMAFDHPTVYQQLTTGPGSGGLSQASAGLAQQVVSRLDAMDQNLQRALKNCQGAWQGRAADGAVESTTPLTNSVRSSGEISAEIGKQVDAQTNHFGSVKTLPPPKKVDPMDLGIGGYTPVGFLAEQTDKEIQERQANAVEEAARQQYTTYQESTTSTTGHLTRYSPVPQPLTNVGAAPTHGPGHVDPNTGYTGNGVTTSGDSSTPYRSSNDYVAPGGDVSPNQPVPVAPPGITTPDGTGSVWAPPPGTTPTPPPPVTPGPGPSNPPGGVPIGATTPPGSQNLGPGRGPGSGGRGAGSGGRTGGIGGPRGGLGTPGAGGRTTLGPGGMSGLGGTGTSGQGGAAAGGTGARGAAGGMGGAGGAGQRGQAAEDEEHQRKYIEDTDEHFEFEGEIDPNTGHVVAPPVLGEQPAAHPRDQGNS